MTTKEMEPYKKYKARMAGAAKSTPVRCMKTDDGRIFVFSPRRSRYGRYWSEEEFSRSFVFVESRYTPTESWHKRLKKASEALHWSGLWPEVKDVLDNCRNMSWEDHQEMGQIYWLRHTKTAEEMDALWQPYLKYPFMFSTDDKGHVQPNTEYLWEMSECRLKSMYFGRLTKDIKAELQYAIEDRRPWSQNRIRTSYDVSVEYDPGRQKAWYSEEYKDCGNGHYYLMLDHSTALFYEND